jgi:hypothetical protein
MVPTSFMRLVTAQSGHNNGLRKERMGCFADSFHSFGSLNNERRVKNPLFS